MPPPPPPPQGNRKGGYIAREAEGSISGKASQCVPCCPCCGCVGALWHESDTQALAQAAPVLKQQLPVITAQNMGTGMYKGGRGEQSKAPSPPGSGGVEGNAHLLCAKTVDQYITASDMSPRPGGEMKVGAQTNN